MPLVRVRTWTERGGELLERLSLDWIPADTSFVYRLAPVLAFFLVALIAGLFDQKRRIAVLDRDPFSLKRRERVEEAENLRRLSHFLDINPFYSFIILTLIAMLALFFNNHLPGYSFLLVLVGVYGWNSGRGLASPKRKLMPRLFMWLGPVYLAERSPQDLEYAVGRLEEYQNVNRLELAWLKGNLAAQKGERREAIEVLSPLPSSPRVDRLLVRLLVEEGELERAEERLSKQRPAEALKMLRLLPASFRREVLIARNLEREGDWDAVESLIETMDPSERASLLEQLPDSISRDRRLIAALYHAGRLDDIPPLVAARGADEGAAAIRELLPEGPARDALLITVLGEHGDYGEIRKIIDPLPPGKSIHLILDLPPAEGRDLLLMELFVKAEDMEGAIKQFDPFDHQRPLALLRQIATGLFRDRLTALYCSYAGRHEELIECLEKYLDRQLLNAAEGKLLARAYAELDRHDRALAALQLTQAKDEL